MTVPRDAVQPVAIRLCAQAPAYRHIRADVNIEAVACDAANASVLHLQPGEPLLHLRRLTWSVSGRSVDYEHLYCRRDAWQCRVQINRRRT